MIIQRPQAVVSTVISWDVKLYVFAPSRRSVGRELVQRLLLNPSSALLKRPAAHPATLEVARRFVSQRRVP